MKRKTSKKRRYTTTILVGREESGKAIRKFVEGKSQSDLNKKVREFKLIMASGIDLTSLNVTFFEYSKRWIEIKSIGVQVKTLEGYKGIINRYLSGLFDYPITNIKKSDCQLIINSHNKHPRTCQQIKLVLSQIFENAIEDNIIIKNPARKLTLPLYKAKEKRALTKDEAILTEITEFEDRQKAFILILKYFGIRREEALALRSTDFNFENDILTISKAIVFIKNRPVLKDTKNHKIRILPIMPNTRLFLKYYVQGHSILFSNRASKDYMTERGFRNFWKTIINSLNRKARTMKMSESTDLTPHIFRHNYACLLSEANIKMEERQYLLGHSSIKITIDIYTHFDAKKLEATTKLSKYISKNIAFPVATFS